MEKPEAPEETGLIIMEGQDLDREFWEHDPLVYMCNDTTLGIDGSNNIYFTVTCVSDTPVGRYSVPRESYNETWPACITKTTTVKPRK